MTVFLDGPAKDIKLMLRRAPHFLRAVYDGKDWDALDQLTDTPRSTEKVFVYEMVGQPSWMHIRATKGASGIYRGGSYRLVEPQPDDETMRVTEKWREWALSRFTPNAEG